MTKRVSSTLVHSSDHRCYVPNVCPVPLPFFYVRRIVCRCWLTGWRILTSSKPFEHAPALTLIRDRKETHEERSSMRSTNGDVESFAYQLERTKYLSYLTISIGIYARRESNNGNFVSASSISHSTVCAGDVGVCGVHTVPTNQHKSFIFKFCRVVDGNNDDDDDVGGGDEEAKAFFVGGRFKRERCLPHV